MKCKFCEGNIIEFNDNYICEKCGTLFKKENDELVNINCPKCLSELIDGKCPYCENEIVINGEDEEEALFCPDCGFALDVHGHCKECGSKVNITFEG